MQYNNYYLTNDISLDIYKNKDLCVLFNDINKKTSSSIAMIEKLLKQKIFKVPCYKREVAWGFEMIYLPFTNKLFKIVNTEYNDTSLQLHPIKNEIWYPLKDVVINDGMKDIKVDKKITINIPSRTTHNMLKDSVVFEVQDNIIFDYNETYRVYDKCNREIQPSKFNAFSFLNDKKIELIDDKLIVKSQILETDSFIYSKNDNIFIEYNGQKKKINKNELWFLAKDTKILKDIEGAIVVEAKYISYK